MKKLAILVMIMLVQVISYGAATAVPAATEMNNGIVGTVIWRIIFIVVIFIVCRELMCWYWNRLLKQRRRPDRRLRRWARLLVHTFPGGSWTYHGRRPLPSLVSLLCL